MIPYIIIIQSPIYNYQNNINIYNGHIDNENIEHFFILKILELMIEYHNFFRNNIDSYDDFIESYYHEDYTNAEPFIIKYYNNNEWIQFIITEEIKTIIYNEYNLYYNL